MPDLRLNGILSPPLSTGMPAARRPDAQPSDSFSDILGRELQNVSQTDGVRFSRHAQSRLESRNIQLDSGDMRRLSDAVRKAADKGVQDSLVVMDRLAFIVSVPDRTVVTAMPVDEAGQNVFTNIDGAVIV